MATDSAETQGYRRLRDFAQDLHFSVRLFSKAPAFSSIAVMALALGIGLNASIFSVVHAVLLRPMAVTDPERLVMLRRGTNARFSYPAFRTYQDQSRALVDLTASYPMESDLDVEGQSEFVVAEGVSGNYASVLGLGPSIGRWFSSDRDPVAVISDSLWRRRFNSSRDVLGQVIRSQSETYTIVAVAPAEFTGIFAPLRTDLWVPVRSRPRLAEQLDDAGRRGWMLFGRLQDGSTVAQVSSELERIDDGLPPVAEAASAPTAPVVAEQVRGVAAPDHRRTYRTFSTLTAGVVVLVLVIVCVNVGGLLVVRGTVRQREMALRHRRARPRRPHSASCYRQQPRSLRAVETGPARVCHSSQGLYRGYRRPPAADIPRNLLKNRA